MITPPFVLYQVALLLAAIPGIVAEIAPSRAALPVDPPAKTVPIWIGVKGGNEIGAPSNALWTSDGKFDIWDKPVTATWPAIPFRLVPTADKMRSTKGPIASW